MFGQKKKTKSKRIERIVQLFNYDNRTGLELEVERETASALKCKKDSDGVDWTFFKWGPSWQLNDKLLYLATEGYPLVVNVENGEEVEVTVPEYVEGVLGAEWENVPESVKNMLHSSKSGVTIKLPEPVEDNELPTADTILDEVENEIIAKFGNIGVEKKSALQSAMNNIIFLLLGAGLMYIMVNQGWVFHI